MMAATCQFGAGEDGLLRCPKAQGRPSIAIYTSRNPLLIKELQNRYITCTGVQSNPLNLEFLGVSAGSVLQGQDTPEDV